MPHTAERDFYEDMIREQGYANVDTSLYPQDIEPAFGAMRDVLDDAFETPGTDPSEIIDAFATVHPSRRRDSAGFLEQRRIGKVNPHEIERGPATEDKDILHFTPRTLDAVEAFFSTRGGAPKSVAELVNICTEIHEATKRDLRPALEAMGLAEYLLAEHHFNDVHLLRVIHYLGSQSTGDATEVKSSDNLAELHFDRSKVTAAIWESAPGLVGAPGNNSVGDPSLSIEELESIAKLALTSEIDHKAGLLKLFLGAGYNHLPEEARTEELPIFLHGVVNLQPDIERDAIVLFINEHLGHNFGVPRTSETKLRGIHGDLSERILRFGGILPPSATF